MRKRITQATLDVGSDVLAAAERVKASHAAPEASRDLHGFRPLPARGAVVTNDLVNELRDELGV